MQPERFRPGHAPPVTGRRTLLASARATTIPGAARAESRFFATSDGVRLHYLDQGRGQTLLLVPGWCMPAWIFAPQVEALSRRYRVVVLDPRGQGQSTVPAGGYEPGRRGRDIGDLIARLGAGRVVVAGWSLGVLDALSWLNQSGDARLAGLVLIDNSVGEGVPPPPRQSNFFANLRRARNTTVQGFCASMFKTPQTPAYLAALARDAQKMPVEASIALLSYPRPREFWRDSLYGTRRPVLYAVTPRYRGQAELVAARHAAATADIYDDAGHALFVDAAVRFNASLDAFLPRAAWG